MSGTFDNLETLGKNVFTWNRSECPRRLSRFLHAKVMSMKGISSTEFGCGESSVPIVLSDVMWSIVTICSINPVKRLQDDPVLSSPYCLSLFHWASEKSTKLLGRLSELEYNNSCCLSFTGHRSLLFCPHGYRIARVVCSVFPICFTLPYEGKQCLLIVPRGQIKYFWIELNWIELNWILYHEGMDKQTDNKSFSAKILYMRL